MKVTFAVVKGKRQALYLDDALYADGRRLSGKMVVQILVEAGVIDGRRLDCCVDDLTERLFPDSLTEIAGSNCND